MSVAVLVQGYEPIRLIMAVLAAKCVDSVCMSLEVVSELLMRPQQYVNLVKKQVAETLCELRHAKPAVSLLMFSLKQAIASLVVLVGASGPLVRQIVITMRSKG